MSHDLSEYPEQLRNPEPMPWEQEPVRWPFGHPPNQGWIWKCDIRENAQLAEAVVAWWSQPGVRV